MTPERTPSPEPSLEDRAILLRRAALQTRFRLAEQRAQLEKIAASLSRARESAASVRPPVLPPAPAPAPAPVARPAPTARPAPVHPVPLPQQQRPVVVNKGTGTFVTLQAAPRGVTKKPVPSEATRHAPALLQALMPFVAIGAAAMVAHAKIAPRLSVVTPPPAVAAAPEASRDPLLRLEPPAPSDDGSAEALLLVHEWVPQGGDRTLLQLLGGELDRPGLPPAWSVERTGPRGFLVRFRDGGVSHEFEADLEARSVRPAGENAPLFAGR